MSEIGDLSSILTYNSSITNVIRRTLRATDNFFSDHQTNVDATDNLIARNRHINAGSCEH